ncbi:uncharacterized protein B0I36DRAFT_316802 [Microdochium trichocladiopsis]|uniref:Uncharacterized protein n=1 Tax=Microdochium trichocladiopsis TaxID=1682393 RepID=A0A9P8YA39_9PEZI|nr:uncharacterized protein B0I36DRAFT_316802 [Microdochium trichocladiopsis]KAH7034718.1 hypothetical protein B0I36DRAFT_316802 [Microdochium trichocladiopsis]
MMMPHACFSHPTPDPERSEAVSKARAGLSETRMAKTRTLSLTREAHHGGVSFADAAHFLHKP